MKYKSGIVILLLGLLGATAVLAACTFTNDPTPQAPLVEVVTVERPSATATPTQLTETATPLASPTPASTATPLAAWTRPPATPKPTTTPFPNLVWSDEFTAVATFASNEVAWSPVNNEFVFQTCEGRFIEGYNFDGSIFKASAPLFESIDLASEDFKFCRGLMDFTWTRDGTQIIFAGPLPEEVSSSSYSYIEENSDIWIMANDGNNPTPILPGEMIARWLGFGDGWMDEHTLAYTGYAGGGHVYWGILDIQAREKLAEAIVHLGGGRPNSSFVATNDGTTYTFRISAAVVSTVPLHPSIDDGFNTPYLHHLSFDDESRDFEFNSLFQDWRPDSNDMLVLTWDLPIDLFEINMLQDKAVTSLQLWNVENNVLTMLVPDATFGRFSPDGRFLLYLTPAPDYPIAHLFNWQNQQIVREQSVVANHEPEGLISFESSFSPDGRFLTYFTPNEDGTTTLQIIDPMHGEALWQLVNPVTRITWSPTNEQFIYRDSEGNLTLFTVAAGSLQRLTLEGGRLLTNPQWSYDGRYLSVSAQNETGGETAVLTIP